MAQYIDKATLVAEIKEYIDNYNKGYSDGDNYKADALKTLLQDIDFFFEVKEANLNKESVCKPANSEDLPEINREVIVLLNNNKVCYAHRPPEYWDGKNIATGEITRYYPKRYDKGNWNIPDVKWWLDLELPKMEE